MNKKGFTLIELMVVIVIIGILAAIAIPKMFGMSLKGKFYSGDYTDKQKEICVEYFTKNTDNERLMEKIKSGNYNCGNYLKEREERMEGDYSEEKNAERAPTVSAESDKSVSELFMSGDISDEGKTICSNYMNHMINDSDLLRIFNARVNEGFNCEKLIENRTKRAEQAVSTERYKIMNDETVIFYSKDAAQLSNDMAEVKDKMTKKNVKSSIQTNTGVVVTYGF